MDKNEVNYNVHVYNTVTCLYTRLKTNGSISGSISLLKSRFVINDLVINESTI